MLGEVVREPKYVQIASAGTPARSITQEIENVPSAQKTEWLAKFCRRTEGPLLVFVHRKSGAERLARQLQSFGVRAAALHADRSQQQRTAAVEGFRGGQYKVLVATDVAARGLDIDGITHVVNFEVPHSRETCIPCGPDRRAAATSTAHARGPELRFEALQRCSTELLRMRNDMNPFPVARRLNRRRRRPTRRRPPWRRTRRP